MKIYVGGLAYTATEDDLKEAFSPFGNVKETIIIKDKMTGQSKGFGFVEMPEQAEAEAAIAAMNGAQILGRPVRVNPARPREERPDRPPRREGRGPGRGGDQERF